ncbi:MAG: PAS domain S-box protein [Microscillaceae bacterium]|nr:PAS domain S-box protein [Microscillaceae bacterium]MDW8461374.1 PAS domain S-box protein [Cytophagales bacterium]
MRENEIKCLLPDCLLNSETYSLVITDLEGKYVFVNEVFRKRFSFIREDLIGQPSFITIYPEDHALCLRAVEQCLANPSKVVKVRLRKPDSNLDDFYWTEWEFSIFKNQENKPLGIICLGHDITETERASRQAKEFAQKIETIVEKITDGFYQLDREWKFVKVNKVAEQILGISRENLIGKCVWDVFPDVPSYNYPTQFRKAMHENLTITFEDYHPDLDKWFSTVVYPSIEGLTVFFRDITQEKKNQIAIQNSENKLNAFYNSTTDSNLLISPEAKIMNFNKVANELAIKNFHKPLQIDAPIKDFLLPEGKEVFDKYFPLALQGETHRIEVQRQVGNKKIWFEVTYLPIYDANNKLIGISLNTKDIDEKKKAELQLKEKEYMLRAIYESTSEASTFLDRNFTIRYNNQVARKITQQVFGKEAQIGENSLDYILPEYKAEFEEYYLRALQGENIKLERTDGTEWWQFSIYPILDEQQQIIGLAQNVQNITERKTRELQLQESETKLQKTLEAVPHPLLIVNENTIIQYVNQEFQKVFGYAESEVLGRKIDFLIPERFREKHVILHQNYMQQGGEAKQMGTYLTALTKDKKEIVIQANLNTFTVNRNTLIIVILQDITELKKKQDMILQQNKVLQKIAWQQSHELRRPLANILGLCNLLQNYKDETEEMKNKYVESILKASKELDEVTKKIVQQINEIDYPENIHKFSK